MDKAFSKSPCSQIGCADHAHSRGLCKRHYDYHRNHGTLESLVLPPSKRECKPIGTQTGKTFAPYKHLIGKVRDAEIAKLAGTSEASAFLYRKRCGIELVAVDSVKETIVTGVCRVKDCDRKCKVRGLCPKCYDRCRSDGTINKVALPSTKGVRKQNESSPHFNDAPNDGPKCLLCATPPRIRGLCSRCYMRCRQNGTLESTALPRGKRGRKNMIVTVPVFVEPPAPVFGYEYKPAPKGKCEYEHLLGKVSDTLIAEVYGIDRSSVSQLRRSRGIPALTAEEQQWTRVGFKNFLTSHECTTQ